MFGFEAKRQPKWFQNQKSTKKKYGERHYLVVPADEEEEHCKGLYSGHANVAVQKGFLMVVLGLLYCKGEQRVDGSRWIVDVDLYRLLNAIDENLPKDPASMKQKGEIRQPKDSEGRGLAMTPDVDVSLEDFVKLDYLMKEKISDELKEKTPDAEENSVMYALGPRAVLEIGKKQILYFCAEILGEEPDQAMLQDLERDEEEEEQEEEMEE